MCDIFNVCMCQLINLNKKTSIVLELLTSWCVVCTKSTAEGINTNTLTDKINLSNN